jgi:hypothetical protein
MKKLLIILFILPVFFSSCLKDTTITTDGGLASISTMAELVSYNTPGNYGAGLEHFGADAVLTAGQTAPIVIPIAVNIASNPVKSDVKTTLAINDAARVTYNGSNTTKFNALPDSCYSFASKIATVKAGYNLDTVYLTIYPAKVDPSQNYMLPVTLTDASGLSISSNFSTAYFHMIGNPLAGNYTWNFTRWNNQTGTGTPSGASFTGNTQTMLPVDPTTVSVKTGYYKQPQYVLSFTNNGGTLSNFSLSFNPDDVTNLFTADGITITDGPYIDLADPVSKHFKFHYIVWNGSAYRYLIDEYIHQ